MLRPGWVVRILRRSINGCGCELLRKEGLAGGLILGLLLAFSASPALAADLELGS